jgi:hypothetical protein
VLLLASVGEAPWEEAAAVGEAVALVLQGRRRPNEAAPRGGGRKSWCRRASVGAGLGRGRAQELIPLTFIVVPTDGS